MDRIIAQEKWYEKLWKSVKDWLDKVASLFSGIGGTYDKMIAKAESLASAPYVTASMILFAQDEPGEYEAMQLLIELKQRQNFKKKMLDDLSKQMDEQMDIPALKKKSVKAIEKVKQFIQICQNKQRKYGGIIFRIEERIGKGGFKYAEFRDKLHDLFAYDEKVDTMIRELEKEVTTPPGHVEELLYEVPEMTPEQVEKIKKSEARLITEDDLKKSELRQKVICPSCSSEADYADDVSDYLAGRPVQWVCKKCGYIIEESDRPNIIHSSDSVQIVSQIKTKESAKEYLESLTGLKVTQENADEIFDKGVKKLPKDIIKPEALMVHNLALALDITNSEVVKLLKKESSLKKKADFKEGQEIGYHGREGEIRSKDSGGYIVYFSDTDEEEWIDEDELIEQGNVEASLKIKAEMTLDEWRKIIAKQAEFMSDKPLSGRHYSYNVITTALQAIASKWGDEEANKAIKDYGLEDLGWKKISSLNKKADYRNVSIREDLEEGLSASEVVLKIIDRYSDIGYEQAADIVLGVKEGGKTDWTRYKDYEKKIEAESPKAGESKASLEIKAISENDLQEGDKVPLLNGNYGKYEERAIWKGEKVIWDIDGGDYVSIEMIDWDAIAKDPSKILKESSLKVKAIDLEISEEDMTEYFIFLDDLRESGVTNMFGASPYLADEFGMDKREARSVLSKWMETFNADIPAVERAKKALEKPNKESSLKSKATGDPEMSLDDMESYFIFLDDLRESGATNMFGASPYLADEFGMDKREARSILSKWMETFNADIPAVERAKKVLEKPDQIKSSLKSKATGEMSQGDIEPGGEDYEWAKAIEDSVKKLESLTDDKVKFIEMRPWDKYQGPYASVTVKGRTSKIWESDRVEGALYIESLDVIGTVEELAEYVNEEKGDVYLLDEEGELIPRTDQLQLPLKESLKKLNRQAVKSKDFVQVRRDLKKLRSKGLAHKEIEKELKKTYDKNTVEEILKMSQPFTKNSNFKKAEQWEGDNTTWVPRNTRIKEFECQLCFLKFRTLYENQPIQCPQCGNWIQQAVVTASKIENPQEVYKKSRDWKMFVDLTFLKPILIQKEKVTDESAPNLSEKIADKLNDIKDYSALGENAESAQKAFEEISEVFKEVKTAEEFEENMNTLYDVADRGEIWLEQFEVGEDIDYV